MNIILKTTPIPIIIKKVVSTDVSIDIPFHNHKNRKIPTGIIAYPPIQKHINIAMMAKTQVIFFTPLYTIKT